MAAAIRTARMTAMAMPALAPVNRPELCLLSGDVELPEEPEAVAVEEVVVEVGVDDEELVLVVPKRDRSFCWYSTVTG
jgi:hypothetical protein